MNSVFSRYLDKFVLVFLDDILVYSKNEEGNVWKLNPGVRTIALTKIANYTCKLHTKETGYGAEH